jgi:hypothetical protein
VRQSLKNINAESRGDYFQVREGFDHGHFPWDEVMLAEFRIWIAMCCDMKWESANSASETDSRRYNLDNSDGLRNFETAD